VESFKDAWRLIVKRFAVKKYGTTVGLVVLYGYTTKEAA
jgi:hypothetical protein